MGRSLRKVQKVVFQPHAETGDAQPPSPRTLIVTADERTPLLRCKSEFGDPLHHPR